MSLRNGITASEEHKLKALISEGTSWAEIVKQSHPTDEKGGVPLLQDVNLAWVKTNIYEPLVKKLEVAKKAGFKGIHEYEADIRKKKAEADAAKKSKDQE